MQPEFHSGAVTRPLSAILQLAMMGCPALRARGELAAGACAPVLGWDRGGSSSAGARAWWGACGTGARGPLRGVFGRLPLARLRESAFWGACTKYFRDLTVESANRVRESLPPPGSLAHTKLTEWFGRYRPVTARFLWCLSTPSSRELLSALLLVVVVAGPSGHHGCVDGVGKARGKL